MNMIIAARQTMGRDRFRGPAPAGMTLYELACHADMPDWFYRDGNGVIRLNGVEITADKWKSYRPKDVQAKPQSIEMFPRLGQGGGGGLLNSFSQFSSFGGQLAGVRNSGLLLAAQASFGFVFDLLFPSKHKEPVLQGDTISAPSNDANISGNILAKDGPIPRVIGTRVATPPIVRPPNKTYVGDDVVVDVVYALAGPHKLEDIRVNGATIDDDDDIEIELLEGWADDAALTLVTTQIVQEDIGTELSKHVVDFESTAVGTDALPAGYLKKNHLKNSGSPTQDLPKWHRFTTRPDPDECKIALAFSEGLSDGLFPQAVIQVPVRVRMRLLGDSTWINLPEFHLVGNRKGVFRNTLSLIWSSEVGSTPTPPENSGVAYAYSRPIRQGTHNNDAPELDGFPFNMIPSGVAWEAHSSFGTDLHASANVHLQDSGADIYLDHADFPVGHYEIELQRGYSFWNNDGSGYGTGVGTSNYYRWFKDNYVFRAPDCDSNRSGPRDFMFYDESDDDTANPSLTGPLSQKTDTLVLESVTSIFNELPIAQGAGLALIAVRTTNKSIARLTVKASGYVQDWNGFDWAEWVTTSNPVPWFRDVMVGEFNADPMPKDLVDDGSLIGWRQYCDDEGLRCDMVAEGTGADSILDVIAACGHAIKRRSETAGVIIERDRSNETHAQLFTPRNSNGFKLSKKLPRTRLEGIRASFVDEDRDATDQEVDVYLDGYDAGSARFVIGKRYEGILDRDKVIARASLDLEIPAARNSLYELTTDVESILVRRGDIVAVEHDILSLRSGRALVKSLVTSGGLVTGIVIDSEVPVVNEGDFFASSDIFAEADVFSLGEVTYAKIRLNDGYGTTITKGLSNATGDHDTITFEVPFVAPDGLERDCLIAVGPLGGEFRRMIVSGVERQSNQGARLMMFDEAAQEIHG